MNVTHHSRDTALLRVLKLHRISQPHDRLLVQDLETTWKREIGLRRGDLLDTMDRMLNSGAFVHCTTVNGAALELTEAGVGCLLRQQSDPRIPLVARLLERLGDEWNTFFVLRRARRRTMARLQDFELPEGRDRRRQFAANGIAAAAPSRAARAGAAHVGRRW